MRNILIVIFVCMMSIVSVSCTTNNEVFILSKEDSLRKEISKTSEGIIVPPTPKYARYTFLIDSSSNVYFYSFQEFKKSTGVFDDDEPELIGLMPNHVFIIPKGFERAFYIANVEQQLSQQKSKSVMIGLFTDSIRNNFLQYLRKVSTNKANNLGLQIRMALPEERSVLRYKLEGKRYDQQ